jgi:hypothetical protein
MEKYPAWWPGGRTQQKAERIGDEDEDGEDDEDDEDDDDDIGEGDKKRSSIAPRRAPAAR